MKKKKFYITTSIAYTNALPHLGFVLESIQVDVLARYHRILEEDVFFLTGTDEHGRKVVEAAQKTGKSPKEFTNKISSQYKKLTKILNLSNNDFIRTTDKKRHWPAVKKVWLKLKNNGDIYKKKYQGLYCLGCEAFVTKKDLKDEKCVFHQRKPEVIEEENYFFHLSKYQKQIKEILTKGKIKLVPQSRKNEMLSFLKDGLEDISFSRPRKDLKWAIPVPGDNSASIYVWTDALTNYISAIGYADNNKKFKKFWPADIHCLGKDIQKFHCLIWPAMLLSLGLSLPKTIFIHGHITVDGQKMSKSLGNTIDPFELVRKYGVDVIRYFLLRELPTTEDGDFTYQKLEERYNSDLVNGLGNLVARVITLAKNSKSQITNYKQIPISKFQKKYKKALDEFKFNEALIAIWELISFCDRYIEKEKPWRESKKQKEIIYNLLFALENIAQMLKPFLPETSERIFKQLKTKKKELLFPKI
jgi:methionyl-tRNA synthetase